MPSPFPGMDPYLEEPGRFPDIHNGLIVFMQQVLQKRLPPPYYAASGRRAWIEMSKRYVQPDVKVLRPDKEVSPPPEANGGGGVAVQVAAPIRVRVPHDERREPFLKIYVQDDKERRLITSIAILSPTNKTPRDKGRRLYLKKQKEILDADVNLLEIDLLRAGRHTTAVPLDRALEKTGRIDYHVCCRRSEEFEDFFVYPIQLAQRLPHLAIPLLPGDPDVMVDLQEVFDAAYDAGPYQREIHYGKERVSPPLSPEQEAWAQQLLTEKGLIHS
ncbi:MAG: DUF4058 family protein [Gemmataceae bacterium]|nr:DUF4058 family protein [Gemmataceae bacterium]MCI0743610.1 DUF4058 family protein [Gemmataceae bacterium]